MKGILPELHILSRTIQNTFPDVLGHMRTFGLAQLYHSRRSNWIDGETKGSFYIYIYIAYTPNLGSRVALLD